MIRFWFVMVFLSSLAAYLRLKVLRLQCSRTSFLVLSVQTDRARRHFSTSSRGYSLRRRDRFISTEDRFLAGQLNNGIELAYREHFSDRGCALMHRYSTISLSEIIPGSQMGWYLICLTALN